jgi:hypothetical protein
MVTLTLVSSSLIMWAMAYPGVADDAGVIRAMYFMAFALGGVGYSVPMGLLIAGIAIPAGFMRLLPRWMVVFGVFLGVVGEASWLSLIFPQLVMLIPLTRFPGFIWLMLAGFMLAKKKPAALA